MANRKKAPTLAFDLSSPLKEGTLLKQGALHKAFRFRFFVLYPGFLVYYEDQSKWKLDVTRGDTLQSRQGAIKLKNGSVGIARQPPKGCKFGLIVYAPDPQNKRPTYLLNAASKEDRDMWIEAIKQGTPHSPKAGRKEDSKPKQQAKKKEDIPEPPKFTQRQETCDMAAVAAAESPDNAEESVTSIDSELEGEPSLNLRRDTTSQAAVSLSEEEPSTNMDAVLEESEPVTSIDDALGPAADSSNSSEAGTLDDRAGDFENGPCDQNGLESEEKEPETIEMSTESTVSNLTNGAGATEVVTSVTVVCVSNSNDSETGGNEREESETPTTPAKENVKEQETVEVVENSVENGTQEQSENNSTEIIIPAADERHNNSFTINSADPDSTSDTDEDGDGSSLSSVPPEISKNGSLSSDVRSESNSPTTSDPPTPSITVDVVEEVKTNGTDPEASASEEAVKLSPAVNRKEGRRASAPFIQKVGYLYKLGGHRKNWKLRYFVLNPGVFFYYKSPKSTKPLGEVKLKNSRIYYPGAGERKTSFQFGVHTESQWNKRMDWVIAAQSEREMKEWISAFKLAGQKHSPNASPTGSDEENSS